MSLAPFALLALVYLLVVGVLLAGSAVFWLGVIVATTPSRETASAASAPSRRSGDTSAKWLSEEATGAWWVPFVRRHAWAAWTVRAWRDWGGLAGFVLGVALVSTGVALLLGRAEAPPLTGTVASYAGTLLGACASALGVVFVFVFVVVEAARAERGAASGAASYAAVLRETRSPTALFWGLATLLVNGGAFTLAEAGISTAPASFVLVVLGSAGALTAVVALGAVGRSVKRTLEALSPGSMERILDDEVARFVDRAVEAERLLFDMRLALGREGGGLRSRHEAPEDPGTGGVWVRPRTADRSVVDVQLRALRGEGTQGGVAVEVLWPGAVVPAGDGWVAGLGRTLSWRDRRRRWVALGPHPERRHLDALRSVRRAATAAVRERDADALQEAVDHLGTAFTSLLQSRQAYDQTREELGALDADGTVVEQLAGELEHLWSMLDRESVERGFVGSTTRVWRDTVREALACGDAVVAGRLLDALVRTAWQRFGSKPDVGDVYVAAFLQCVQGLESELQRAKTADDLARRAELIAPVAGGWLRLLNAAYARLDWGRYRDLVGALSEFSRNPGFTKAEALRHAATAEGGESATAQALSREQILVVDACERARRAIAMGVLTMAASALRSSPRRKADGRGLLGPTDPDALRDGVAVAIGLAGGMTGLVRGYGTLAMAFVEGDPLGYALQRALGKVDDVRMNPDLPDGLVLASLYAGTVDPDRWEWGKLRDTDELVAVVTGGGPVDLPLHVHQRAKSPDGLWDGWDGLIPADSRARIAAIRAQLVSGHDSFYPPLPLAP
ncbi:MAG: hypothetical protein AAGK21_00170 [Bacteroidota bacterium]